MNLKVQRKDKSVFLCDVNGVVIAHFPNIIDTKNQRSLLKAVRIFLKSWIDQLDNMKHLSKGEAKDELDTATDLKEDIVKEKADDAETVAAKD